MPGPENDEPGGEHIKPHHHVVLDVLYIVVAFLLRCELSLLRYCVQNVSWKPNGEETTSDASSEYGSNATVDSSYKSLC